MRRSQDHILTSHAGSLPRPDDLIDANRARESGGGIDERRFQDHPRSGIPHGPRAALWPVCVDTLTYTGHESITSDIAHFKAALQAAGVEEGFMTSIAPGSASRIANRYYKTEEEFLFACADTMREEYKAIVDAGLVLQLDDPAIAENWDMVNPEPAVADYKKFSMVRVEALNHAIRDLPEDRIRLHLCWGSWHGPHTTDIAMRDIVDVMLAA